MSNRNYYREWGESGILSPTLFPSAETKVQLFELQASLYDQLVDDNPDIEKVKSPHATIIYLNPARLLELMRKHVDRKIRAERLYPHLMEQLSMLLLFSSPSDVEVQVTGLGQLGPDGSVDGVTLNESDFADASLDVRGGIQLVMREFGMNDEAARRILQEEPSLEWALGTSVPHISLLNGVMYRPTDFNYVLPGHVVFDGVNIGSAIKSPDDPEVLHWWHLRGLRGDPLRSKSSPAYEE